MKVSLSFALGTCIGLTPMLALAQKAPLIFVSRGDVPKWAKDTKSGKFEVHNLEYNNKRVLLVFRAVTTESNECEIWAFLEDSHFGLTEALRIQRLNQIWPKVLQQGDSVSIVNHSTKVEILRFSISQLQAAYF